MLQKWWRLIAATADASLINVLQFVGWNFNCNIFPYHFQLPPRLLRVAFVACLLVLIFSHFTDSAQGKRAATETKARARCEHNALVVQRAKLRRRQSKQSGLHCEFKFFAIINNARHANAFLKISQRVVEIFSLAHESARKTVQLIIQFFNSHAARPTLRHNWVLWLIVPPRVLAFAIFNFVNNLWSAL